VGIRRKRVSLENEDYQTNYSSKEVEYKPTKTRFRWRFKPYTFLSLIMWGILAFIGFKVLLWPLIEGVYGYFVKTAELKELRIEYQAKQKKLIALKKTSNYMKTDQYIEKRGRQLGFVKKDEAADSSENSTTNEVKSPEIGD